MRYIVHSARCILSASEKHLQLTHNVHGPHDEKFYAFLSGLQEEYDNLKRSGYAGEGFFSPGQRVGTSSHNVTPQMARLKALQAAEKRTKLSQVMGSSGGRRLGGPDRTPKSNLSRRELAAMVTEVHLLIVHG
jgi:hypothetical protein